MKPQFVGNTELPRLILSILVIFSHSSTLTGGGRDLLTRYFNSHLSIGFLAVGIFFGLSGYLLAPNAFYQDTMKYLLRRLIRIFPGLFAVVLITSLTIFCFGGSNARSWNLFYYFYSNINFLSPDRSFIVAGIFENNPLPGNVNGSLWTINYEFWAYALILIVAIFSRLVIKSINLYPYMLLLFAVITTIFSLNFFPNNTGGIRSWFVFYLPIFFFGGFLRYTTPLFLVVLLSVTSVVIFFNFDNNDSFLIRLTTLLMTLTLTLISCKYLPSVAINGKKMDIAYGVYLWGFPIQQSLIYIFDETGLFQLGTFSCFILSTIVAIVAGTLSWIFIESPSIDGFAKRFK